jgi:predicted amidohydrolase YtcJ
MNPLVESALFGTILLLTAATFAAEERPSARPEPVEADLVLLNAKIWTGGKARPDAEALAVWRGRILAVGTNADIRPLAGKHTRQVDAKGRRVLPGFHDSHLHFLGGGLALSRVALKDARDEAEFGRRLRAFDERLPRERWLLGGEWDHDRTFAGQLPTAEMLDKYVQDRPAFLHRYDGHMALVNSRVLKMAGITADTPDPAGGVIYRKAGSKEPTGILRDNAMELVAGLIPALSAEEVAEGVHAALVEARRVGVTSVQDMDGSPPAQRRLLFRHYQRLAASGRLSLRVQMYWPIAEWKELAQLGLARGFGDDWVRIGALKGFMDGSLGSSTAKMFDPFVHEPKNSGVFVTPRGKMSEYIQAGDKAELAVAVHAIGDEANAVLLDLFAEAAKQNGPRDRRFRIEHAQHLRPEDYRRFRDLEVIASMQPYHAIDDGRWAEGRIGAKRCASSYACRSLLDAGARLAFGSDWPVAPLSPLLGIDAAVNRRTLDGKHPKGWFPEQKIQVADAVEAYTVTAAYAAHEEKDKGTLEAGKLADLVVLSRDILSEGEREHIAETEVVATVVGGKVVYEKGE